MRVLAVPRTRPPVGEEGEEVGDADGAVTVEVTQGADFTPRTEQRQQVGSADVAVAVGTDSHHDTTTLEVFSVLARLRESEQE